MHMIEKAFVVVAWLSLLIWIGFVAYFGTSEASEEIYNRLLFAVYSVLEFHFLLAVYDKTRTR